MDWDIFSKTIAKSGIDDKTPWKIVSKLFKEAGCIKDPSSSTIAAWIQKRRRCSSRRYFPNERIDTKRVFNFFRKRDEEKLAALRESFIEVKGIGSPIDVDHSLDVFCWSLVNQFLDLLRFQRIDVPYIDTTSETVSIESNQLHSVQKGDTLPDVTQEHLKEIPYSLPPMDCPDSSKEVKQSIRSLMLPNSGDCCYNCTYWTGTRNPFRIQETAIYGPCIKYGRREQLSSDFPCREYKRLQESFFKQYARYLLQCKKPDPPIL